MSADRRWLTAAALFAAGAAVVIGTSGGGDEPPSASRSLPSPLGEAPPGLSAAAVPPEGRVAPPAWIRIPAIETRSDLLSLGLQPDGSVEVPSMADADRAGWYRKSARPGASGPAVVIGHLDSTEGAAVFYRLAELERGDVIEIGRKDRSVVRFRVTHVGQYDKDRFPTEAVYGPTRNPQLPLITCGGDYGDQGYEDNVVVFAVETGR